MSIGKKFKDYDSIQLLMDEVLFSTQNYLMNIYQKDIDAAIYTIILKGTSTNTKRLSVRQENDIDEAIYTIILKGTNTNTERLS